MFLFFVLIEVNGILINTGIPINDIYFYYITLGFLGTAIGNRINPNGHIWAPNVWHDTTNRTISENDRRRFFKKGLGFCTKFDRLNDFYERRASYHCKS